MKDGLIEYPYKLEKGKSNQRVAFDILKNQGFSGSIINNAIEAISGFSAGVSREILRSQPYFAKASKGSTCHSSPDFQTTGYSGEVE